MTEQTSKQSLFEADAVRGLAHVFVRDLVVDATVGVHEHEKAGPQPLRISIDLTVREIPRSVRDDLSEVVCYEDVVRKVQAICSDDHVNLIETLAERIAASCLEDGRVRAVRVRVEKTEAFAECASVGIEIERLQAVT
ncbi:dihydroneopterin aldolase [bacterium BMS3Bbin10]|nr:dihydroneopterin aldolase [bacterium BMS3Bbin10]